MSSERGRTKKLIVAFHFQYSNQAAWNCESCRKSGLEKRRRCGWLPGGEAQGQAVVWARKSVMLDQCPRSYISAQSLAWLEEFFSAKALGMVCSPEWPARTVEAFLVLEEELAKERKHDER